MSAVAPQPGGPAGPVDRPHRLGHRRQGHRAARRRPGGRDKRPRAAAERPEMGTLFAIETANTVVLAIVSALSVPVPAQREGESELWIAELGLVGELWKAADGRAASFNRGVSVVPVAGRPGARRLARGAGAGLLRRPAQLRARRLHPAGPVDLGQRPRRRSARQAFCHRGNHRHRQVLHHGADPARDPAEAPGRPHGAARSAQRVRARLRRMGRGHQPAQHAAALLAPHLRGADRGADRQSAGAQGRSGDAAGPDPDGQGALRRRPRQHARGRPAARAPTSSTRWTRRSPTASRT